MKKTIVLNESDLHRIISESVKRILNEMNEKYIVDESLNELDPRTYASYAEKRAQQANGQRQLSQSQQRRNLSPEQIQQQAQQGRQAGINKWNQDYGWQGNTDYGEEFYKMTDGGYNGKPTYTTHYQNQNDGWGTSYSKYNPYDEDGGEEFQRNRNGYERWIPRNPKNGNMSTGDTVAHQMSNINTAEYKNGKWGYKKVN